MNRLIIWLLLLLPNLAGAEESYLFQTEGLRDPFRAPQLALSDEPLLPRRSGPQRSKEFLESMHLDSLKLVAIVLDRASGQSVAMLEDAEGTGHALRVGNYLGLHEGRITRISDGELRIEEPAATRSNPQGVRVITLSLHTAEESAPTPTKKGHTP
ncbi:MAG: pilus assembly protein PilP [Magnetococcales bacterium]|nr:pilus assembly protein PilP [Magnetococcales bacterium]